MFCKRFREDCQPSFCSPAVPHSATLAALSALACSPRPGLTRGGRGLCFGRLQRLVKTTPHVGWAICEHIQSYMNLVRYLQFYRARVRRPPEPFKVRCTWFGPQVLQFVGEFEALTLFLRGHALFSAQCTNGLQRTLDHHLSANSRLPQLPLPNMSVS